MMVTAALLWSTLPGTFSGRGTLMLILYYGVLKDPKGVLRRAIIEKKLYQRAGFGELAHHARMLECGLPQGVEGTQCVCNAR